MSDVLASGAIYFDIKTKRQMVGVDIYVFMSLCLMFGVSGAIFLTKRQKDRLLGLIFCFYVFMSDVGRLATYGCRAAKE